MIFLPQKIPVNHQPFFLNFNDKNKISTHKLFFYKVYDKAIF